MDPKETLKQARRLQLRIDSRLRELRRLEDMVVYLSATDYARPVVQHSASRGAVERMATMTGRADRLREYLRGDVAALEQQKLDAIALIGMLEDPRQADVLWEYYVRAAKNWDEAADAVGYSRRQTLRLHGQALQALRLALNGTADPC
jgi:hypothetical protein